MFEEAADATPTTSAVKRPRDLQRRARGGKRSKPPATPPPPPPRAALRRLVSACTHQASLHVAVGFAFVTRFHCGRYHPGWLSSQRKTWPT